MAIVTSIATSFKQQMLNATQDIDSDSFKIALYTSSASLGAATTAYTITNECTGVNYVAGGVALSGGAVVTDGTTVIIDFTDATFTNISVADIRGFMIYNTTHANACVAVFDFGSAATVVTSNYTLVFPAATAVAGLIRFA